MKCVGINGIFSTVQKRTYKASEWPMETTLTCLVVTKPLAKNMQAISILPQRKGVLYVICFVMHKSLLRSAQISPFGHFCLFPLSLIEGFLRLVSFVCSYSLLILFLVYFWFLQILISLVKKCWRWVRARCTECQFV